MQLDETDRALLARLGDNARTPVATLARALGIARTTVQARIDRLVAQGAIAGFTIVPGRGLAAPIRATVLVSVEPRSAAGVLARMRSLPDVTRVLTTSGRCDLLIEVSAASTEALDATLDEIGAARGVKGSESLVHLSTKIDRRL